MRFFHRGEIVTVDGAAPTRTVLQWLREDARCTGTKEGCAEGDCGACTVVLGETDAAGGLQLRPVNACIQFLPTLDGKALFTVEDLAPLAETCASPPLHPIQQGLVRCHGSQCGFCTPGFVMSLWAAYEQHLQAGEKPSRQQVADSLSGNLCRCTGYRPILDAAEAAYAAPPVRLPRAPVLAALQALAQDPPLHYAGAGAHFHAPQTLAEFAALRLALPQARVLAGSTDVGLWVNKQFRELGDLLYIGRVAELQTVQRTATHLEIGAAATLQAAWQALVAEWPALHDLWLRFAGLPVRLSGTMGGNVANGSPIGDSAPVLIALGSTIVLRQGERVREMPLEDFYTGYMKNRLEPGEFVQALRVPLASVEPASPAAQSRPVLRAYKISKRFDCDISALCAAFSLQLEDGVVRQARVAYGGMAATVCRAPRTEAALQGQPWTESTLQAATAALALDYQPLSDLRASAAYRLQVAQNLLRRCWLETRAEAPLALAEVSVFARGDAL